MSLNLQICTIKMIMTYLYLAGAKSPFENSISTSNLAIILRQWCCFGKIIFIVSVPRALIPENDQRDLGTHVPTRVTRLDDFLKFWMKYFVSKIAQMYCDFWAILKTSLFRSKLLWQHFCQLLEKFGLLLVCASGHTGWDHALTQLDD